MCHKYNCTNYSSSFPGLLTFTHGLGGKEGKSLGSRLQIIVIRQRKNLEASIIAVKRPKLNDQVESRKVLLFRNGVT